MSNLKATNLLHPSSTSNNIVLGSDGTVTAALTKASLPAGSILQVVSAAVSTNTTNATNSYVDTGVTATITPTSTSSKVLVITNHLLTIYGNASFAGIKVLRGATEIHVPISDATGPYDWGVGAVSGVYASNICRAVIQLVDSPNTTSATTYKTQFRRYRNAGTVGINTDGAETTDGTSYIILMEVKA